jgi:hypothetical protein
LLKRQGAESASKSIHYKRTDRHLLEVEHWGYLHALKCVVRMLGHQRPERKAADEPAVIPISARTRAEVSRDVPARRAA